MVYAQLSTPPPRPKFFGQKIFPYYFGAGLGLERSPDPFRRSPAVRGGLCPAGGGFHLGVGGGPRTRARHGASGGPS